MSPAHPELIRPIDGLTPHTYLVEQVEMVGPPVIPLNERRFMRRLGAVLLAGLLAVNGALNWRNAEPTAHDAIEAAQGAVNGIGDGLGPDKKLVTDRQEVQTIREEERAVSHSWHFKSEVGETAVQSSAAETIVDYLK